MIEREKRRMISISEATNDLPRGSVLGRLLFLSFTFNLPDKGGSKSCFLFAHYTKLALACLIDLQHDHCFDTFRRV